MQSHTSMPTKRLRLPRGYRSCLSVATIASVSVLGLVGLTSCGQAMTDVVGGTIPLVYTAVAGAHGFVKSGRLRAVAVSSAKRSSALPDMPTFIESGVPDFVVNSWVGLLAPLNLPPIIASRLNTDLNAVLYVPAVRERLRVLGIDATPGSAEQFREEMRRHMARYGEVVKAAGISVE
jgi:tripartite-type tricarboxylate transporter receptor subunit TctC